MQASHKSDFIGTSCVTRAVCKVSQNANLPRRVKCENVQQANNSGKMRQERRGINKGLKIFFGKPLCPSRKLNLLELMLGHAMCTDVSKSTYCIVAVIIYNAQTGR